MVKHFILPAVALAAFGTVGCSTDKVANYCDSVQAIEAATDAASESSSADIPSEKILRELRGIAPAELVDDYDTVLLMFRSEEEVLADAEAPGSDYIERVTNAVSAIEAHAESECGGR